MEMIRQKIKSLIYAGIGLVLCVLLCGGMSMTAQAEERTDDGFYYEENKDGGITITGYTGDETELVIPGEIDGKGVTSIGDSAFRDCSSLTSIKIPAGVTSIGDFAFEYCYGLTSIEIPAGVTSIGESAFEHCSGLTSIEISAGVTSIGESAFEECYGLTSIEIPAGVTSIGVSAFEECESLTSIEIPAGVTSIGHDAFGACLDLVIACYKDSYAYNYAIDNNIPVKLLEVETPGDASGDDKPTPNPTTPSNPKNDDTQQKPKAVPAKKGTTLTVSSKKLKVKVTSSSKKNPTVTVTKITDKKAKKLTIPASVKVKGVTYKVTGIADKAFKNNKKLTTVTIGSNVNKIGKEAFSGCSALKKVTIGKNVTSIGNKAFYKCTKLASVTIPAKVTTIGDSAFAGCKNLKKITVTAGKLQKINKNAFKGIKKNAAITVKGKKQAKTALKKKLKKSSIGYVKTWKLK